MITKSDLNRAYTKPDVYPHQMPAEWIPVRDAENAKTIVWPTAGSLSSRTGTLNITVSLFWPYGWWPWALWPSVDCAPPAIWLYDLHSFLHGPVKTAKDIDIAICLTSWQHDNDNSRVPSMASHIDVTLLPLSYWLLPGIVVGGSTSKQTRLARLFVTQNHLACRPWKVFGKGGSTF